MLTLQKLSLDVARIVMPNYLIDGEATAVTATSITDTKNLIVQDELFNKGTCWINSGTHAGKVFPINSHFSNKINFDTLSPAPGVGDLFTIAPRIYPYTTIRAHINQALEETFVLSEDDTLVGDGTTLDFSLPAGVWDVSKVRIQHPTVDEDFIYSSHFREKNGLVKFDFGYAPPDNYKIVLIHKEKHSPLTTYNSEINHEINTDWLKYKSAEKLLDYGMGMYGNRKEYRIEERMNIVLSNLQGKSPRRSLEVRIKTAPGFATANMRITSE